MDKDRKCRVCGRKTYMGSVFCYEHFLQNEKEWEYNNECVICGKKIRGVFTYCKKCYNEINDIVSSKYERMSVDKLISLYDSLRFELLSEKFDYQIILSKLKNMCAVDLCLQNYDESISERIIQDVRRIFIFQKQMVNQNDFNQKYVAKRSSLSKPELVFLKKLECVIDKNKYKIETQKSLRQMVDKVVSRETGYELNRDIDFVIVDKNYRNVLLIEYNDSTHNFADRIKRDENVKLICKDAGLKLIFIQRDDDMSLDYLRGRLEDYL